MFKNLIAVSLFAVVALGCAHGQRSYIDPTAAMNPEPAAMWSRPQEVGYTLGERIQGQPIIQFNSFANATLQAANPGRDLIFVGTRNTSLPNKVVALSSATGLPVWTYQPGDLGMINGGFLVDYEYNRLFIAARGTGSPCLAGPSPLSASCCWSTCSSCPSGSTPCTAGR